MATSCCEPVKLLPGPRGDDGAPGADGANGVSAFTTLTANFTVPNVAATAVATVGTTAWMVIGEPIFIQNGGVFYVTAIGGATSVTVQNPAAETGNVAPTTIVASGNKVAPSGFKGASGAAGGAGTGVTVATKGDIQTYAGAPANLGVGADGRILHALSAAGTGLTWAKVDLSSSNEVNNNLPVANGGTGSSTASGAATNLAVLPLAGGTLTGDLRINKAAPRSWLQNTSSAANEGKWFFRVAATSMELIATNDAEAALNLVIGFLRSGATPTEIDLWTATVAKTTFLIEQYLLLRQAANTALVNGNNNDVAFGNVGYVKIKAGPTGAFTITGIAGGVDARVLLIQNATGQNMTIGNENVLSSASNRILTLTGADFVSTADCFVKLIYDIDGQRWIVMGTQG